MERVGIRELRASASRILRSVRNGEREYVITFRGDPVAILRPLRDRDRERLAREDQAAALDALDNLAGRVSRSWSSERGGVELVEDQRR